MSYSTTKDLTDGEKLDLILSKLAGMETRLTALESQVANGACQPLDQVIRETVQARDALNERMDKLEGRLNRIEQEVRLFGRKMEVFNEELLELLRGHREAEDRLSDIERNRR